MRVAALFSLRCSDFVFQKHKSSGRAGASPLDREGALGRPAHSYRAAVRSAVAAAHGLRLALGLRRQAARRSDRRREAGGAVTRDGLPDALGGAVPDPRLRPVSAYRGSDDASMAADNTSGFNCRFVGGTSRWSMRLRRGDRRQPGRESVRARLDGLAAGRPRVSRPLGLPARAWPCETACSCGRSPPWLEVGASFGDYQHFSTTGR